MIASKGFSALPWHTTLTKENHRICHTFVYLSPKEYSLAGEEIPRGEELYLTLQNHHQSDSALRWAAVRTVLMFQKLCGGKSQRQLP